MPPSPYVNLDIFRLTRNPADGTFTVGSKFYHKYVVYDDVVDSAGDSNTQLGDVSNDHYTQHSEIDPTTFVGKYIGSVNNGGGFVGAAGTSYYLYTNNSYSSGQIISANRNQAFAVCYAAGTLIRTERGDVAIDALALDDLVLTTSGKARPIRWLGHRVTDCTSFSDPHVAWPIRIAAHAFGENRPARDLRVSPAHSIAVDILGEVLIPACALVNGSTVKQERVDKVTYWHVELDSHDVILAENLPAESYLEMSNRGFFTESVVVDLAALPDGDRASVTHADFCRPLFAEGPVVEVVRAQLRRQAEALGFRLVTPELWADVALDVDGVTVLPETLDGTARFVFPAEAREVWLTCPTGVPAAGGTNLDSRALGLCLAGLTVDDGLTGARAIAIDDPRLGEGLHDISPGHRWTKDRARIPSALWDGCRGTVFLRVETGADRVPVWVNDEIADEVGTQDDADGSVSLATTARPLARAM